VPLYEFVQVKTGKKTEIFFPAKDCPSIGSIYKDENGVKWKRVFSLPFASVDTKIDPNSASDFVTKTGKKRGTYGDLLDASKELSEKRTKERGEDPVKKKFFKDYSKKRFGVKHIEEKRATKIDSPDFSVSFD
jgi:hypothetical protein